jgi:hypothetical protein
MDNLCGRCKQPFVRRRKPDKHKPTATWHAEYCPDCVPATSKPHAEMDCYRYIQARRVGARLRDGYHILLWGRF